MSNRFCNYFTCPVRPRQPDLKLSVCISSSHSNYKDFLPWQWAGLDNKKTKPAYGGMRIRDQNRASMKPTAKLPKGKRLLEARSDVYPSLQHLEGSQGQG